MDVTTTVRPTDRSSVHQSRTVEEALGAVGQVLDELRNARPLPEWVSVAQICEATGFCQRTVTRTILRGRLPATKVNRQWRVRRSDYEAWVGESKVQV
jgi:excisionase family DNA binding protein